MTYRLWMWLLRLWKRGTVVVHLKSGERIRGLRPPNESPGEHARTWRQWLEQRADVRLDVGVHSSSVVKVSEIAAVEIW